MLLIVPKDLNVVYIKIKSKSFLLVISVCYGWGLFFLNRFFFFNKFYKNFYLISKKKELKIYNVFM